jgi:hypothetical protein
MADEVKDTSVEETGSVEVPEGGQEAAAVEETINYKALYEKERQERENLSSVLGRQGQEIGDLRKKIEGKEKPAEELDPYQYFDGETAKAIEKLTERKAMALLESYQQQQENARMQKDFQVVLDEYDVNQENLGDLAFYASSKGVTVRQAAEFLASKGIIEKRKSTTGKAGATSSLDKAPVGAPKVAKDAGRSVNAATMSQQQWNALSPDEREKYLRQS